MIWVKTEAGRAEVQRRALVNDRSLRALLVLIDGKKAEEGILRSLPGSTAGNFQKLRELGLIAGASTSTQVISSAPTASGASPPATQTPTMTPAEFEALVTKLRKLISTHLGLGGLALTLALDQARTVEKLTLVARRTLEQIQGRQDPQAAAIAREALRTLIAD